MTSTSEQRDTEVLVNQHLDDAQARLPESVRDEITQSRLEAVRIARSQKASQRSSSGFLEIVSTLFTSKWQLSVPVAVAVVVVMLVSYTSHETIPPLPGELLVAEFPGEDLGLLEDLEFATWLAQQEQGATN